MVDQKKGSKLPEPVGPDSGKRKPPKLEYRGTRTESMRHAEPKDSKLKEESPEKQLIGTSAKPFVSEGLRTTGSSLALSITGASTSSARKPRKIALDAERDPVTGKFPRPVGAAVKSNQSMEKSTSSNQAASGLEKANATASLFAAKSTRSIGTNIVPNALPLPHPGPIVRGLVIRRQVESMRCPGEAAALRESVQKLSLDPNPTTASKLITTSAKLPFSPATTSTATSPSLPPTTVSEPTYDRKGRPKFWTDLEFEDGHSRAVQRAKDNKHHWLRLSAGQGGTFGYGKSFKDERGESVYEAVAKTGSKKVNHLQSYGDDIKFIGTEECCTCLGVYFEIEGNRVFCAHVNAWLGTALYMNPATRHSPAYYDIKRAFLQRLTSHATEHGWGPESVNKDSIRLVSIFPNAVGFALQDALQEIFALPIPLSARRAHGFIILPGYRSNDNRMAITLLGTEVVGYRTDDDGDEEPVEALASAPDRYKDHPFVNTADGMRVREEWMYTIGLGWHHTTGSSSTPAV